MIASFMADPTTALAPQNQPPFQNPEPEPPRWLKPVLVVGGILLTAGVALFVRRKVTQSAPKAVAPPSGSRALPAAPIATNPQGIPVRPVVATRGFGGFPRRRGVSPTPVATPPAPAENPWEELDQQMASAPLPSTVEVDGDGETAGGIHYVWRVYRTDPNVASVQAVVMLQDADGSWSYWGPDPSTPYLAASPTPDQAMDQIREWGDTH
jgi:hypothetical protein